MYTGPNIITNGLVLALDAANTKSYPGSGTVWSDLSGNNYSGSLVNGPTFSSASGGGIFFDGSNDYVDVIPTSSGSAASSYTFSVWFYPNSALSSVTIQRGVDGSGNGWSLLAGIETNKYRVGVVTISTGAVGYVVTSSVAAIANQWVNVTGVWNAGSSLSLYINGSFQSSRAITTTTLRSSNSGWVLGRLTTTSYSSQIISNTSVYNRTLSESEILQNYNATKARFGL
jgi:hypothetical protein